MEKNIDQLIANNKDEICFIIGNRINCLFFLKNKQIKSVKISFDILHSILELHLDFLRINQITIINTSNFIDIVNKKERMILMKTGNILNVSRRNWEHFK